MDAAPGCPHEAKPTARPSDSRLGAMRRHVSRLPLLAFRPSCSKLRSVGVAILVGRLSTPEARGTELISASSRVSPLLMGVRQVQISEWASHRLLVIITTETTTNASSPATTVSPITVSLLLYFIAAALRGGPATPWGHNPCSDLLRPAGGAHEISTECLLLPVRRVSKVTS